MPSNKLKKSFFLLSYISKIKNPTKRRKILELISSDNDLFDALRELALNLVEGNIPVKDKHKSKLQKNKKLIKALAASKAKKNKKKLVVQSGGVLPFLIPAAATILGTILKDVVL